MVTSNVCVMCHPQTVGDSGSMIPAIEVEEVSKSF
uniref:Uncharacterized protein n=1 Tax=Talaromyces marneffei PM1 TaxID=1077442 RepID=A0A093UV81_TALMA